MARGGKREGAGRKPNVTKKIAEQVAEAVFSECGGESKAWQSLLNHARNHDPRLAFDILRYWTDRKYGKSAQSIEHSGPDGEALQLVIKMAKTDAS